MFEINRYTYINDAGLKRYFFARTEETANNMIAALNKGVLNDDPELIFHKAKHKFVKRVMVDVEPYIMETSQLESIELGNNNHGTHVFDTPDFDSNVENVPTKFALRSIRPIISHFKTKGDNLGYRDKEFKNYTDAALSFVYFDKKKSIQKTHNKYPLIFEKGRYCVVDVSDDHIEEILDYMKSH